MADVEMTDAAASAPKAKPTKASAGGAELGDKKRFEVKKARHIHTHLKQEGANTDRFCSGTPLPCGHGTSLSTTALSAATTSWTFALTARPTRLRLRRRSARWLGESAT